tara:strand:- start:726 stop:1175 length:450 start_codon:yes stop_codon:yes gene_type:complete
MNTKIYNNKYNIIITNSDIKVEDVVKKYNLSDSKQYEIYKGDLNKIAFKIREYELKHDEIFSGNILIHKLTDMDIKTITNGLVLTDNCIYVTNYISVGNNEECSINQNFMYCSSMVLWIMSQYSRNEYPLFHNLRRSRILLKRFGDYIK